MFVLGLQGSPRKKGNTSFLLSRFLEQMEALGAETRLLDVPRMNVEPCKEYVVCEKRGYCPIEDDMAASVYGLLREADVIVAATPIFFYNATAQLKALIDRCQTLWARKYKLRLKDPGHGTRKGFLLSAGATKGRQLFDGLHLTMKYFFDAVDAEYAGSLTYRGVEGPMDMKNHPGVEDDIRRTAAELAGPFAARKPVLFFGRNDSARSQMAAAFARLHGGGAFAVRSAGRFACDALAPFVQEVMAEKGIDMAFRVPRTLAEKPLPLSGFRVVKMDAAVSVPPGEGFHSECWRLPPAVEDLQVMRELRDTIEEKVLALISGIA